MILTQRLHLQMHQLQGSIKKKYLRKRISFVVCFLSCFVLYYVVVFFFYIDRPRFVRQTLPLSLSSTRDRGGKVVHKLDGLCIAKTVKKTRRGFPKCAIPDETLHCPICKLDRKQSPCHQQSIFKFTVPNTQVDSRRATQ